MAERISEADVVDLTPKKFRRLVREEKWTGQTQMACHGYVQANLAVVPKELAFEFLTFCFRNSRPCPVLDVTDPGNPHPRLVASEADLRTDVPRYRVFKEGRIVDELTDVTKYWQKDLVAFLLGCSLSFEWALRAANVRYRFLGAYATNIPCVPSGVFHGPMVVTCRLIKGAEDAIRTIQICSRHLFSHGAPVHIGDPKQIGIKDLYNPDMGRGDPDGQAIPPQEPDEIALFWGCGVTPQAVAISAKPSLMITHFPGCMFVADKLSAELVVL
jgi:uncharacterized protein YcsI (UPF0317 family)